MLSAYLKDMGNLPILSCKEEVELFKRVEKGCEKSREKIIKHNLRLVLSQAKRYKNRGVPLIDLIQEGNIGLIKAIGKFDYRRGYKFSTYAVWWIAQSVTRALDNYNENRALRFPISKSVKLRKYTKLKNIGFSNKEILDEMGISISEVSELEKDAIFFFKEQVSLSKKIRSEDNEKNSLGDTIPDMNASNPLEEIERSNCYAHVVSLLKKLPKREKAAIKMRFGIGCEPHTLDAIGKLFGVTRERARQIEKAGINRLKCEPFFKELCGTDSQSISF